eukprot:7388731-Prymnesium_polylepis.1
MSHGIAFLPEDVLFQLVEACAVFDIYKLACVNKIFNVITGHRRDIITVLRRYIYGDPLRGKIIKSKSDFGSCGMKAIRDGANCGALRKMVELRLCDGDIGDAGMAYLSAAI